MQVTIEKSAPPDWDAYVEKHKDRSAYHLGSAVAIAGRAFGFPVDYLTARNDAGDIAGVLPLVEQSSIIFGHFITSLPYVNYGGILANDDLTAIELANHAAALGAERNADHVELRQFSPISGVGLAERCEKVAMILPLPDSEDELSSNLGSKLRSQIRRAERENPEVEWGGRELLSQFYDVFSVTMRDLGTPVYSRRFFDVVADALSDRLSVIVVRVGGHVQAAAVNISHGNRIEVSWAAATHAAKRNSINMRMYWEMLRKAVAEKSHAFDFGRCTRDSGTYKFKAQWGAEARQLHWYYWLPQGRRIPQLNNSNPKYGLAVSAWQRMPLWLANALGPRIVRYLP